MFRSGDGPRQVASAHITGSATPCQPGTDWHDAISGTPQHVYGNTWYVGTCGVTALLVTSAAGHILLDATSAGTAPQIADGAS